MLPPRSAQAQRPVTLAEAVDSALERGPAVLVARADSAAAAARYRTAHAFPNPDLAFDYTKDVPKYHLVLEQPLEYPWVRGPRIHAARTSAESATLLLRAERATVRYQVQTAYIETAASAGVLRLSQKNAADGRELLRIAEARQSAGDASRLDVQLARVTAGQLESAALADSLDFLDAAYRLQLFMGVDSDTLRIQPADSLESIVIEAASGAATPGSRPDSAGVDGAGVRSADAGTLRVRAARLSLESSLAGLSATRRTRLPVPALRAGFEQGDPGGEPGLLPTFGVSLPLPLFNLGGGEVAAAAAEAERARAELTQAEWESSAALAAARRRQAIAARQLEHDRAVATQADSVASMATTAYREGESPLVAVIEAQRNARDALRQLIQDLAATRSAEATLLFARTAGGTP